MDDSTRGPVGRLIESASALLATLLTIGHTRLELLTVELQLEVRRAAELALWAFIAVFASAVALLLVGLAIIIVFWDSYRILAAGLVCAAFVGTAALAVWVLASKIRNKPPMLQGTLAELARDADQLGGGRP